VSGRYRITVVALLAAAALSAAAVYAFASVACPVDTESQPCPSAGRNLAIGIGLASLTVGLAVTPFAFLGEFMARRRIVYRGAWARAARRGALVALVVATLAALRLGGTLSVPIAMFVVVVAGAVEWLALQRERPS
jgi:hypothetical protein